MKFKKDAEPVSTMDFWYDLTDGGYIDPDDLLEPEDAKKVKDAIAVISEFESQGQACGKIEMC